MNNFVNGSNRIAKELGFNAQSKVKGLIKELENENELTIPEGDRIYKDLGRFEKNISNLVSKEIKRLITSNSKKKSSSKKKTTTKKKKTAVKKILKKKRRR